jgi:DNA invertase Pin-like site-specific DNA recombinase
MKRRTPVLSGYMRVSKADPIQVLGLQRDALLAAGVNPSRLYEDHTSGKRDSRPGLEACLNSLNRGDTLLACKLDRIGRDLPAHSDEASYLFRVLPRFWCSGMEPGALNLHMRPPTL